MNLTVKEMISGVVAETVNCLENDAVNENEIREQFKNEIRGIIDRIGLRRKDFEQEWKNVSVFFVGSHLPGCLPDESPHYLSEGSSVKDAIIHELEEAMEIDRQEEFYEENEKRWTDLIAEAKNTPEETFKNGVDIGCPDNYVVFADRKPCESALLFDMREILDEIESECGQKFEKQARQMWVSG